MTEYWGRGKEGTKRKRYLIMYAFSCEREQKECECVRGKKGERPRERDYVCVQERHFCDLLPCKAPSD